MRILFIDKNGYPVEKIKGRRITNIIRILLHTRSIEKWESYEKRTGIKVV